MRQAKRRGEEEGRNRKLNDCKLRSSRIGHRETGVLKILDLYKVKN